MKFDLKSFSLWKNAEIIEQLRKKDGPIISSLGVQGF